MPEYTNRSPATAKGNMRTPFRMSYDLPRLRNRLVINMMAMMHMMPVMVVVTMPRFSGGDEKQAKKYDAGDAQHVVSYSTMSRSTLAVTVELRIQHDVVTNHQCLERLDRLQIGFVLGVEISHDFFFGLANSVDNPNDRTCQGGAPQNQQCDAGENRLE
jgi:hypothetical protein